jgi:hypothetical protein
MYEKQQLSSRMGPLFASVIRHCTPFRPPPPPLPVPKLRCLSFSPLLHPLFSSPNFPYPSPSSSPLPLPYLYPLFFFPLPSSFRLALLPLFHIPPFPLPNLTSLIFPLFHSPTFSPSSPQTSTFLFSCLPPPLLFSSFPRPTPFFQNTFLSSLLVLYSFSFNWHQLFLHFKGLKKTLAALRPFHDHFSSEQNKGFCVHSSHCLATVLKKKI